jgi:hypothetical protein
MDKLIRSRFKADSPLEQREGMHRVNLQEMIDTLRKHKKGSDMWKEKAQSWEIRLEQEPKEAMEERIRLRLQHARPRLKAPRRLWIEVLTNRPVKHRVIDRWKTMSIEVDPRYTAEEICHKVRSRWKDRWKVEWEDEEIDQ